MRFRARSFPKIWLMRQRVVPTVSARLPAISRLVRPCSTKDRISYSIFRSGVGVGTGGSHSIPDSSSANKLQAHANASIRFRTRSLPKIWFIYHLTVPTVMPSLLAISRLVIPTLSNVKTSSSIFVSRSGNGPNLLNRLSLPMIGCKVRGLDEVVAPFD